MKNIITINGTSYEVSEDTMKSVLTICVGLGKVVKAETETSKATTVKAETKPMVDAYTVDGKNVTLGGNGFVPRKVFYAIKCSLQEAGAKWNATDKVWQFATKKDADAWVKAQKNRK